MLDPIMTGNPIRWTIVQLGSRLAEMLDGLRNKNERIFRDTAVAPDALQWTLEQFRRGRLTAMIEWAGHASIVKRIGRGADRGSIARN
jgi:hypothetical protein